MKPVEFIIKEGDEHLTSHMGLALIGALLNRTGLGARIDAVILLVPRIQEVLKLPILKLQVVKSHLERMQSSDRLGTDYL